MSIMVTELLFYRSNSSAWMTRNYLKDCLKWIYNKFASENRKIVLFMDGPNIHVIGERDKIKNN